MQTQVQDGTSYSNAEQTHLLEELLEHSRVSMEELKSYFIFYM